MRNLSLICFYRGFSKLIVSAFGPAGVVPPLTRGVAIHTPHEKGGWVSAI
jgi:hypothetical protein